MVNPKRPRPLERSELVLRARRHRAHGVRAASGAHRVRKGCGLYQKVLSTTDRDHLLANVVGHMSDGVEPMVQERGRAGRHLDAELGRRITAGLRLSLRRRCWLTGEQPTWPSVCLLSEGCRSTG